MGKEKDIKEWVVQYSDVLYTRAYHKTSSKEIAEDLVQDTFLAAHLSYDTFNNLSTPKTWLFSILNYKIIDYYRLKSKKGTQSLDHMTEEQGLQMTAAMFDANGRWTNLEQNTIWENESHLLDNAEFTNTLTFCIGDLPEKWGLAIQMKYLFEKDAALVCQELEISQTNYWQIIHRAKLLLKKCIEKHWKG
jgi:RNA polymerase sigma-70 factor (TIGR02943 family)